MEYNANKNIQEGSGEFIYSLKSSLVTQTEKPYLTAIKKSLPQGYFVQPQINLASIIQKDGGSKYQNELYRNIDACVFDMTYKPIVLIEINDKTHNDPKRRNRDMKVKQICEEAGIQILFFWTTYGVNQEYISKRINEAIVAAPNVTRIAYNVKKTEKAVAKKSNDNIDEYIEYSYLYDYTPGEVNNVSVIEKKKEVNDNTKSSLKTQAEKSYSSAKSSTNHNRMQSNQQKSSCYIATAVYGSYDCENVWVLRRFRDYYLAKSVFGRGFIKCYYSVSPALVKLFGECGWFTGFWRKALDKMVSVLKRKGYSDEPYADTF